MPGIPPLKLGNVGCGGGWGVGEQFASLPSHDEQRAGDVTRIFTVSKHSLAAAAAAAAGHISEDEETEKSTASSRSSCDVVQPGVPGVPAQLHSEVLHAPQEQQHHTTHALATAAALSAVGKPSLPTTQYVHSEREDDDDTFVDHGSSTDLAPSKPREATAEPLRKSPVVPQDLPFAVADGSPFGNRGQRSMSEGASEETEEEEGYWEDGRLVSRVHCSQPIFGLAVVGRALWTAIGDDPLTLFELSGCDLTQQRSVASVTGVRSVAVVNIPAAKVAPVTFKQIGAGAGGGGSASQRPLGGVPLSRSGSNNPVLAAPPEGSNQASDVLWCGLDRGRIAIVDLFFFSDAGVIPQAHGVSPVTGIWAAGPGRVWSAGDDHTVKLWDAASRKVIRLYKVSDTVADMCYVPTAGTTWLTCREAKVWVYNTHDGQEVRIRNAPFLKTKSKVHNIRCHAMSQAVWVVMEHDVVVYHAKTMDTLSVLSNLACRALEFHDDIAIFVGHTPLSSTPDLDQIILVDAADPRRPVIRKLCAPLEGISRIGFRCFQRSPLAVAAHTIEGSQRCLTVFTTEGTEPLGNWGLGPNAAPARDAQPLTTTNGASQPAPASRLGPNKLGSMSPEGSPTSLRKTATPTQLAAQLGVMQLPDGLFGAQGDGLQAALSGRMSGLPVVTQSDPAVSSALLELQKQMTDVSSALRTMRVLQPVQEDFTVLHAVCVRLAPLLMTDEGGVVAAHSSLCTTPTGLDDVTWRTTEGRMIGVTMQRLLKVITNTMTAERPIDASADDEATDNASASKIGALAAPSMLVSTDRKRESNSPTRFSASPSPTAVPLEGSIGLKKSVHAVAPLDAISNREAHLHRQMSALLRMTEVQRTQANETVTALRRQNARLSEKLTAMQRGLSTVEGCLRAYSRDILQVAAESGNSVDDQSNATQCSGGVEDGYPLDEACTMDEINNAFLHLQSRIGSLLSAKQHLAKATAIRLTGMTPVAPMESATPVPATPVVNGRAADRNSSPIMPAPSPLHFTSGEGSRIAALQITLPQGDVACPADPPAAPIRITPKRLFACLRAELSPVEQFARSLPTLIHCIEGSYCRLQMLTSPVAKDSFGSSNGNPLNSSGEKRLDTSPVLHDLLESEVMCKLCRHEMMCVVVEELVSAMSDTFELQQDEAGGSGAVPSTGSGGVVDSLASLQQHFRGSGGGGVAFSSLWGSAVSGGGVSSGPLALGGIDVQNDKEDLDSLISFATTVSIDLETAGSQLRRSFQERYRNETSAEVRTIVGMFAVVPRVNASLCRLRGLLSWAHVWVRFLACALDEVQGILFPKGQVSGSPIPPLSARGSGGIVSPTFLPTVMLPRRQAEFLLEKISEWRSELEDMRAETVTLFHGLSEAQRIASGEWPASYSSSSGETNVASGPASGSAGSGGHGSFASAPLRLTDLTKQSLISACLQLCVRRSVVSNLIPPILAEEPTGRVPDSRCEDLYGLIADMLENIGAVLQTKIDALLPVCKRFETMLQSSVGSSSAPAVAAPPNNANTSSEEHSKLDATTASCTSDGEEEYVVCQQLSQKPPLEECHKQFCMAI